LVSDIQAEDGKIANLFYGVGSTQGAMPSAKILAIRLSLQLGKKNFEWHLKLKQIN
jgi:hypothetical protein